MTGREVRRIRKRLALTQGEFAGRIGVDLMTVSRWERGKVPIREPMAKLIRLLAPATVKRARRTTPNRQRRGTKPGPGKPRGAEGDKRPVG